MSVSLPLVIDRIHVTVAVPSKTLFGLLISQLYEILSLQEDIFPTGKIKLIKKDYYTQLDFSQSPDRKTAEIIAGSTKSKHLYFKLVLYLTKFKQEEFENFKHILNVLLSEWAYEKLLFQSRVSYLEIAKDFVNKAYPEFFPYHPNVKLSKIYFGKKDGEKGSTNLGSVASVRRFCVYDKAKQLVEEQSGSNFEKLIRVEVRLRKTGMSPYELLEGLENPFHGLRILSVQKLLSTSQEEAWLAFVEQCRCVGTAQALGACSKQNRKLYKTRLDDASVDWWDSSKTWAGWPAAFAAIVP
ncbi:hypothetical protein [Hydrogenophaga sp.]|uniref:hypothetical protein n=1 Tax=Hydrogenophaga sp. TaxID=1904254 RepID=UPI00263534DA|nr:hypothetical protein [Hydrogenophaga sp.]MDM7948293.1 hypothetical protein [Hydrogenophaga sp.]